MPADVQDVVTLNIHRCRHDARVAPNVMFADDVEVQRSKEAQAPRPSLMFFRMVFTMRDMMH